MPFICPDCSNKSINITSSLELPPDSRSDEIALQILKCSRCDFEGLGIYEESRRGSLDSESVDHRGYRISRDDLDEIRELIKRCGKPRNARCRCATHRKFGRVDSTGRWNALTKINITDTFKLRLL